MAGAVGSAEYQYSGQIGLGAVNGRVYRQQMRQRIATAVAQIIDPVNFDELAAPDLKRGPWISPVEPQPAIPPHGGRRNLAVKLLRELRHFDLIECCPIQRSDRRENIAQRIRQRIDVFCQSGRIKKLDGADALEIECDDIQGGQDQDEYKAGQC